MACALVLAGSQGVGCSGAGGSDDGAAGTETGGDGVDGKQQCRFERFALLVVVARSKSAEQLDLLPVDLVDGGEPLGERGAELREALRGEGAAGHFQHHLAGQRKLLLDHRKDALADLLVTH